MNGTGYAFVVLLLATVSAAAQNALPPGAAACSGCHGSGDRAGAAVPALRGMAAEDIVAAMQAFRKGERSPTVMDRIAKGFSDEEIQAMALWFGRRSEEARP